MYYENFPVLWNNIYQNIKKSGNISNNTEILHFFSILEIKDKVVIVFSNFHNITDYFNNNELLHINQIIKENLNIYNITEIKYQQNYIQNIMIDKNKTLESFLVSTENRLALAVAQEIISDNPEKPYSPLYLYSKTGLGKSHLINGIILAYRNRFPNDKILYYSGETFLNSFFEATKNNNVNNWKNYNHNCDLFIIDDIQFLENNINTINELYSILNYLYTTQNKPQIIITCNKDPNNLDGFSTAFKSRLQWGIKLEIKSPTNTTKTDIIKTLCKKYNITINKSIIAYIAENNQNNIREIEGLIKTIASHAILLNEDINLELINNLIGKQSNYSNSNNIHSISGEEILYNVCMFFNISEKDIKSKNRTRAIAYPRQIGMYLTKTLTNYSLQQIGKIYGGRDHSTVKHSNDKIKTLYNKDLKLKKTINQIINLINNKEVYH